MYMHRVSNGVLLLSWISCDTELTVRPQFLIHLIILICKMEHPVTGKCFESKKCDCEKSSRLSRTSCSLHAIRVFKIQTAHTARFIDWTILFWLEVVLRRPNFWCCVETWNRRQAKSSRICVGVYCCCNSSVYLMSMCRTWGAYTFYNKSASIDFSFGCWSTPCKKLLFVLWNVVSIYRVAIRLPPHRLPDSAAEYWN